MWLEQGKVCLASLVIVAFTKGGPRGLDMGQQEGRVSKSHTSGVMTTGCLGRASTETEGNLF